MGVLGGKGKSPKPTDPRISGALQAHAGLTSAKTNTLIGNANQYTPDGSLEYKQTGSEWIVDPGTGIGQRIPTYSAIQTLSPAQQAIKDQRDRGSLSMARAAADGASRFSVTDPAQLTSGLPEFGNLDSVSSGEETRRRVEQALLERMNPSLSRDREALRTQLSNQGIKLGTEAYDRGMEDFGRQANDARLAAILGAGQEADRVFNQDMTRFNAQNDLRGRAFNERLTGQNQSLAEILALRGDSQLSQPVYAPFRPGQVPTTDMAGLVAGNDQVRAQNAAKRSSLFGNIIGAAGKLGEAAIEGGFLSDRNAKKDVKRVGNEGPLGVYEFRYKGEKGPKRKGYMAQEVAKVKPSAVVPMGKYLGVDYSQLPEVA